MSTGTRSYTIGPTHGQFDRFVLPALRCTSSAELVLYTCWLRSCGAPGLSCSALHRPVPGLCRQSRPGLPLAPQPAGVDAWRQVSFRGRQV